MSFPAHDESDPAAPVEADLYVCVDVARREAAARGHSIEREILLYAVHGTLHACGYRDDTEAAAAAIHAEEDRILSAGGFGSVYARRVADGASDTSDA
jgi:probable rRNA maturation factor